MNPYYTVEFRKQVHSCFATVSSTDVFLARTVHLPFPPYHGLRVSEGEWEAAIVPSEPDRHGRVEYPEIYWDTEKLRFRVYLVADKTLYWKALEKRAVFTHAQDAELKELVDGYVSDGWTAMSSRQEAST